MSTSDSMGDRARHCIHREDLGKFSDTVYFNFVSFHLVIFHSKLAYLSHLYFANI